MQESTPLDLALNAYHGCPSNLLAHCKFITLVHSQLHSDVHAHTTTTILLHLVTKAPPPSDAVTQDPSTTVYTLGVHN